MLLLGGRLVDLDAERRELQPADLAVDRGRHRVHAGGRTAPRSTSSSTHSAWSANDTSITAAG